MNRWAKGGLIFGMVTGILVGGMGFLHTKPGRPLLARLAAAAPRKVAACLLGFDVAATPEQKEASRRRFAATHAGPEAAAARPALGFELDRTTQADIAAWATTNHLSCKKPKSGADLDCSDVPGSLLPAEVRGGEVRSLWLRFGDGDKLVSLTAVRRVRTPEEIAAVYAAVTGVVASSAGAASSKQGDPTTLGAGALRQASAEFRFRNYHAMIRATNMGDGFALTEDYRALPELSPAVTAARDVAVSTTMPL